MTNIAQNAQKLSKSAKEKNITLIAASKVRSRDEIKEVYNQGIAHFGENYIQEAKEKFHTEEKFTKHFIGHLQSNKADIAVELFDVIHTIHSTKLANAIEKACTKKERGIEGFIQVNIGHEPQKSGVMPENVSELVSHIKANCPHIKLLGLMCIPPKDDDPRPHFKAMKQLASQNGLTELSMGMSHDWEAAVEEGATHVRIGTALFGPRVSK